MVDILPLKGLIYNLSLISDLSRVISPPYDIVSPEMKKKLYSLSPYNIIRLILPQERNNKNKYEVAKDILQNWINQKILKFDDKKCFYIFEENYGRENSPKKILGFIGLTKIEPYHTLNILRHEKTLSLPKQDRLNLLKNCRTNFGLIYTLYNDPKKELFSLLKNEASKKPFVDINAGYDPGLKFKLWRMSDIHMIEKVIRLMKDKKLLIADGHHRYETSLAYRNEVSSISSQNYRPEDYILTLYMDSEQKNIEMLPIYRIIKFRFYPGIEEILNKIKRYFSIEILNMDDKKLIIKKLSNNKSKGKKSFCIYSKQKNACLITLKFDIKEIYLNCKNINIEYENLDINILHNLLLNKLLPMYEIENIQFTQSIEGVKESVDNNLFDIGIILNPPTIKEIEKLSIQGVLLPQKSTYFYPKPCSGLVMYKFDI